MKTIASDCGVRPRLDAIRRSLAETNDLKVVIGLRVQVVLIEDLLKSARFGRQILIESSVLKLQVERKAGRLLRRLHLRGGDHFLTHAAKKPRLEEVGISDKDSANWQMESRLPDDDFDLYTRQAASKGRRPSSNAFYCLASLYIERMRLAGDSKDPVGRVARGLRGLAGKGKRFASIYIDPPCAAAARRAKGFRIDPNVAKLRLMEVAAPQAHLYLRVDPRSPEEGVSILDALGFCFRNRLGRLQLVRARDSVFRPVLEMWLLGVRRDLGGADDGLPQWLEDSPVLAIDCGAEIYDAIERLSKPPCLELFGSKPFSGEWTVVGARGAGAN